MLFKWSKLVSKLPKVDQQKKEARGFTSAAPCRNEWTGVRARAGARAKGGVAEGEGASRLRGLAIENLVTWALKTNRTNPDDYSSDSPVSVDDTVARTGLLFTHTLTPLSFP